jgi:hypothetical protein
MEEITIRFETKPEDHVNMYQYDYWDMEME